MRARGLIADLVIVNEQASSYVQDLQQAIESLCENSRLRGKELGPRQHIFAVRRDLMDETPTGRCSPWRGSCCTRATARIFDQIERAEAAALQARDAAQACRRRDGRGRSPSRRAAAGAGATARQRAPTASGLDFWNGFGGFDRDGRDYVVRLPGGAATPQPWINVISNAAFGFHISAEGASFTWSRNSRDFQLTPWSNDPVTNRPGEAIYVHDHASGKAFSPFAAVARDASMTYEARHGQGFSHLHAPSAGRCRSS